MLHVLFLSGRRSRDEREYEGVLHGWITVLHVCASCRIFCKAADLEVNETNAVLSSVRARLAVARDRGEGAMKVVVPDVPMLSLTDLSRA